jgi:amino acid adenylation domain-containing protein
MRQALLQEYADYQSESHSDRTAVVYGNETLTYGELTARSNGLARLLKESGCKKGGRIGILLPKSIEAVISILATLKADCIYVPIDTGSPLARVRLVLESSACDCLLATTSTRGLLEEVIQSRPSIMPRIGWLDPDAPSPVNAAFSWKDLSSACTDRVEYGSRSGDVAHILFTSGSTGIPKGVTITHDNVRSFVDWGTKYFKYDATDRLSGHPPLHFDLSTFDMFGTFASGAQLHLVPPQMSLLPHRLATFIRDSELTQWFSVPSLLNYMSKFDAVRENDFPALRRLLWCGENFPAPALRYWMQRLPHVSFTNLYGPTEATIASSYYRVPAPPSDDDTIPIGAACDGEELLIFDTHMNPVAAGETGDLYIRGVGLSPGYWRDLEKTATAFVQNPRSSAPDRIYRTGDLASMGENGLVYLHGRADSQVKSRGYRIELGEIESALHANAAIRECAVVAIQTQDFEGVTICCAVVPVDGAAIDLQTLRRELGRRLPGYMLPVRWICADSLPLNGNGKIDRVKIRENFQLSDEGSPTQVSITRARANH